MQLARLTEPAIAATCCVYTPSERLQAKHSSRSAYFSVPLRRAPGLRYFTFASMDVAAYMSYQKFRSSHSYRYCTAGTSSFLDVRDMIQCTLGLHRSGASRPDIGSESRFIFPQMV